MPGLDIAQAINDTCPWSGKPIQPDGLTLYRGSVVGLCNPGCPDKFDSAIRHFDQALSTRDEAPAARDDPADRRPAASP